MNLGGSSPLFYCLKVIRLGHTPKKGVEQMKDQRSFIEIRVCWGLSLSMITIIILIPLIL